MLKKLQFLFMTVFVMVNIAIAQPVNVSGVYPSLAYYNTEGECGTGAVVSWAGKLWVVTYSPHKPFGSSDKLYEIGPDLSRVVRSESIGGTHANRMIHKESNQLFIGYHVIDAKGNVRTIPWQSMPGRLTGMARSVTDPANTILYATMEEGFYEVNVHTLEVKVLFKDGNQLAKEGAKTYESALLPGVHGKGFYSGQGVYVYSNNGEAGERARVDPKIQAGSLSEWDGKNWKVVRRNQFVEVTGPGGIYGNPNPSADPIWATGWDFKSVLLAVRDKNKWKFFRLPKATNTYDGAHGWNTEWPRIRNIGTPEKKDLLMTMHGMFWRFPETFRHNNTAGIRPRSSYLKVVGDFERWQNKLVVGCDDAAFSEFLGKRPEKGGIAGPGQSNSNLWFTDLDMPDRNGVIDAYGSIYLKDTVGKNATSEPYLFAGWANRTAWIANHGKDVVRLSIEADLAGTDVWKVFKTVEVKPGASMSYAFSPSEKGEWIRIRTDKEAVLSFSLAYTDGKNRMNRSEELFTGLAKLDGRPSIGGILHSLGGDTRRLGLLTNAGYYEMDSTMRIVRKEGSEFEGFIREKVKIPPEFAKLEDSSYLIVDVKGRRWRLPLGNPSYSQLMKEQALRICREVVTERDLFNCGGTFYELPAENADGYAKIRPISSHDLKINDYASYRGMMILSGIDPGSAKGNKHIYQSDDGKAALWAGVIDDLWKLGRPVGRGAVWYNTPVKAGQSSDPYLFGGYQKRSLSLSASSDKATRIRIEIDPTGENIWFNYMEKTVPPNGKFEHVFSASTQGKWIRFTSLDDASVTAKLIYE